MDKAAVLDWARRRMGAACEAPMEPGFRHRHGLRVAALALRLAERVAPAVERDLLEVAGVLHDIGKSGGRGSDRHGPRGARIVRRGAGRWLAPEELQQVCGMVEHHYARAGSRWYDGRPKPAWSAEVLLLQDADLLDHFGCNQVWQCFCWARRRRRTPEECLAEYWRHPRDPDWREEARRSLNYEVSREELAQRLRRSDAFFRQYALEQAGEFLVSGH